METNESWMELHGELPSDSDDFDADYDPTPWCSGCGSMTQRGCDCGPIAENE